MKRGDMKGEWNKGRIIVTVKRVWGGKKSEGVGREAVLKSGSETFCFFANWGCPRSLPSPLSSFPLAQLWLLCFQLWLRFCLGLSLLIQLFFLFKLILHRCVWVSWKALQQKAQQSLSGQIQSKWNFLLMMCCCSFLISSFCFFSLFIPCTTFPPLWPLVGAVFNASPPEVLSLISKCFKIDAYLLNV